MSIEFQQALQESVMLTLQRRTATRLAGYQATPDGRPAEAVIASLLTTQTSAREIGAMEPDPIRSQLRGTTQPLLVRRKEQ